MQLNSARGRKLRSLSSTNGMHSISRFMQLNPARGRKPVGLDPQPYAHRVRGLCSSTPRGDGNWYKLIASQTTLIVIGLCSSTPRGDGNPSHALVYRVEIAGVVYAAQPREGTETWKHRRRLSRRHALGLCSSTPRGDGNETLCRYGKTMIGSGFMQLNPARGRKLTLYALHTQLIPLWFMQLNPARGRKQILLVNVMVLFDNTVYAAQPREGTETPRTRFPLSPSLWFMQLNPARGRKPYRS